MVTIGSVKIDIPVMNAACSVAKTIEDVQTLCRTRVGAVLVGSITPLPRKINPAPNLQIEDIYALNSYGMPNSGKEFYQRELSKMVVITHAHHKKFVLNIAGFSLEDYVSLAQLADINKVDLLELNFACPNVGGEHITSFNTKLMYKIIKAVQSTSKTSLMVKLSPYSDPAQLQSVAHMLARARIAAVVTSNTFPNGIIQSGHVQDFKYAGISGKSLQPIALGQVRQFRSLLPVQIKVVGVGGIETKHDVLKYFAAGADMVQAATLIVRDGHEAINALI